MENLICSAYTYLEFNKDYNLYLEEYSRYGYTSEDNKNGWEDVRASYVKVSEYMSDEAITQAQELVIQELT